VQVIKVADKFNGELWDVVTLNLTETQKGNLEILQSVLLKSKSTVASALQSGEKTDWARADITVLENELLKQVSGRQNLRNVFDVLAKVIFQYYQQTSANCCYPRSLTPVRLEANPFHGDFAASENLISRLSDLLVKSVLGLPKSSDVADLALIRKVTTLGVLSSVIHFHLLHKSMLVALVEALANPKTSLLWANNDAYAWSLSLPWQGEHDAESRMFVPDQLTAGLLARVPEPDIRRAFAAGFDQSQPMTRRHNAIYAVLEKAMREMLKNDDFGQKVGLNSILQAAGNVAYLHMPPVIAAARSRKFVNHSPPRQVMLRIFHGPKVEEECLESAGTGLELSTSEIDDTENELADKRYFEPLWLKEMRRAFRLSTKGEVRKVLLEIAEKAEQPGPRFAGFGLSLMDERGLSITSSRRFSLLVAKRCGCRMGKIDPSNMPIEDLENEYRDALEDDWDGAPAEVSDDAVRRNKRATIQAIVRFHKYLKEVPGSKVPELEELAPRLKLRGLLHVDANFITIDEYHRVLKSISGVDGPHDPYLKKVLRLIVILAFRCGLRRCEVLYLFDNDLDTADHLYVRKNDIRDVKTRNSTRSIPAGLLLSESELTELKHFISERVSAPASLEYHLLFSTKKDASIALNQQWLVDQIHNLMRKVLGDNTLKLHHLRHSFATLLIAKLLPNTTSFVRLFLNRRHPETLKWLERREDFRSALFGTSEIRALDITAVAHLLGHGSPATGAEHYIHSLDWFDSAGERQMHRLDRERLAARHVTGQSKSTAHRNAGRSPLAGTAKALKRHAPPVSKGLSQESKMGNMTLWFRKTVALLERHYRHKESITDCAADLDMSPMEAQLVVDHAANVAAMRIGLTLKRGDGGEIIPCPVVPDDEILVREIVNQFGKLAKRDRKFVREAVETYAANVLTNNRMMLTPSTDVKQLREWMHFVRELRIDGLGFRFIGFQVGTESGNVKHLLYRVGIRKPQDIVWVKAPNQNSRSVLNHLGIEVVYKSPKALKARSCGEFRYVMAIAAISRPQLLWDPIFDPIQGPMPTPTVKTSG
jgi:integrase